VDGASSHNDKGSIDCSGYTMHRRDDGVNRHCKMSLCPRGMFLCFTFLDYVKVQFYRKIFGAMLPQTKWRAPKMGELRAEWSVL